MLSAQVEIYKMLMGEGHFACFKDILVKITDIFAPEQTIISEIIMHDMHLDNAHFLPPEKIENMASMLRSTMTQEGFSSPSTIPYSHKERTEKLVYLTSRMNLL